MGAFLRSLGSGAIAAGLCVCALSCTSHVARDAEQQAPAQSTVSSSTDRIWTVAQVEAAIAPLEDFHVIAAGPLALASDLPKENAQALINEMAAIRQSIVSELFEKEPARLVPVFCARDSLGFVRMVREITGSEPIVGTGFFTRKHFALFLNNQAGAIGTGCHELTHAMIAEDIGKEVLPIWLNEGVASVWEWPELKPDGSYVGGATHRITQLAEHGPIPLTRLLEANTPSATGNDFGGQESGRFQATARLLCVFLQQQEMLGEIYRASRDAALKSELPVNLRTVIEDVTGEALEAFESRFLTWLHARA